MHEFVHLVGLYTHCNMMHGTYNIKPSLTVTPKLSASKHRFTTNLNYIMAHNVQTEFKEEFYKIIGCKTPYRVN